MRPITGYSEATATNFNGGERLPAGGYVIRILDVKEESTKWGGEVIIMRFAIAEGEFVRFYQKQYDNASDEYKKWKGTYRLNIPQQKGNTEDDIKKYKRSLGFFKSQSEAINKSNGINIDCSKEWDVSVLKNKIVGMVFGNKEWEMDGKSGWFTNPDHMLTIEEIREGKFKIPADSPLQKNETSTTTASSSVPEGFDELDSAPVPF